MTDPATPSPLIPILSALVRALLLVVGVTLTSTQAATVTGAAMALVSVGWSVWQKVHANNTLTAALQSPALTPAPKS